MEEQKEPTSKTKFTGSGIVNATEFGKMLDCDLNAVKKMFGDKLTEGFSYLKEGRSILIDVEKAREELRSTVNPRTCKNPKLLEFLDLPKVAPTDIAAGKRDDVEDMTAQKVREELNKSELRISRINERVLEGKYVERSTIEKNLEAIGIEIRNVFAGISSRVTPQMLAAATERDAENILNKAVEDALMAVANIASKDLTA